MLVFDWKRRAALFALGVVLAGFGVALSTQSGLGATPISSVFLVGWFVGLVLPRLRGLRKACYHWVTT